MTDHDEIATMIAGYALHALDARDERIVATHLAACRPCARAYAEALETVGALAIAVAPVTPPPALRGRLLAALSPTASDEVAGRRRLRARPGGWRTIAGLAGIAAAAALAVAIVERRTISDLRDQQNAIARLGPVSVVVGPGGQRLLLARLASAPFGHAYQLWAIVPQAATPLSLGLISGNGTIRLTRSLVAGTTLAITIEPAGGSPAPTTRPIAAVAI